jgi:hypothetical protein
MLQERSPGELNSRELCGGLEEPLLHLAVIRRGVALDGA